MPFSTVIGRNATSRPSTSITAFIFCSAKSGHAISGIPSTMLSRVELQPQWHKNPPVEPWLSTRVCGAQDCTTKPRPLRWQIHCLASSPPIKTSGHSFPIQMPALVPPLPKETYRTERLGCLSNQLKQYSDPFVLELVGPICTIGPTGKIGSIPSFACKAFIASDSIPEKLLMMIPSVKYTSLDVFRNDLGAQPGSLIRSGRSLMNRQENDLSSMGKWKSKDNTAAFVGKNIKVEMFNPLATSKAFTPKGSAKKAVNGGLKRREGVSYDEGKFGCRFGIFRKVVEVDSWRKIDDVDGGRWSTVIVGSGENEACNVKVVEKNKTLLFDLASYSFIISKRKQRDS
ncbi:hypothetical protein F8388_002423 [Cannabis sativa]|uniref:Uncharacterized protein n=1 Tax=Cannabis sativa TaxID=3483 RepID=A0A7J6EGG1_CANSA|nr:hypothetical protein F8388_002423 [Cannabis sativa]